MQSSPHLKEHEEDSNASDDVMVYLRIKPCDSTTTTTTLLNSSQMLINTCKEPFSFDQILPPLISQEKVWNIVMEALTKNFLSGYNGTAFAYGQTGSGKTYTMQGNNSSPSEIGITPRTLQYIFENLPTHEQVQISCSFVEIYNENIFDLLSSPSSSPSPSTQSSSLPCSLRESEGIVRLEGCHRPIINSAKEAMSLYLLGTQNRRTAETSMNRESSRSHSIFTINLTTKTTSTIDNNTIVVRESRLNLIDLAGSERQTSTGAIGKRLKEAGNINRSLLALSLVITSLTSSSASASSASTNHIPYRDSKLTHLLKDSLGGNSKTVLIANICPIQSCLGESISTLRFSQRVKMVKNLSTINENYYLSPESQESSSILIIEDLKREVTRLKELLSNPGDFCGMDTDSCGMDADSCGIDVDGSGNEKMMVTIGDNQLPDTIERVFLLNLLERASSDYSFISKLQRDLEDLYSLSERRERQISSERMIIKFRDQTISTLTKQIDSFSNVGGGNGGSQNSITEMIRNYQNEILEIKKSSSCNPEILRLTIENRHLKAKASTALDVNNNCIINSNALKRLAEYEKLNIEKGGGIPLNNIERRISDLTMEPPYKKGKDSLLKEKDDEIKELTMELEKSLLDHQEIGREMSILREDLQIEKENNLREIQEIKEERDSIGGEMNLLKEKLSSHIGNNTLLKEKLLINEERITLLQVDVLKKDEEVSYLKGIIKEGELEIERVRGEILVAIEPLERRVWELEHDLEVLEKERDSLEEELLKQRNENDRLCQHGNMKQKLQYHLQIKGENNQFREEIRQLRDELSRIKS